jgi:Glycosyl transferase family 8
MQNHEREGTVAHEAGLIRVFVGASPAEVLPLKVLEHTIREHTTRTVELAFMSDLPCPIPKDASNQPGTNFSFYRFMIPELTGYRGKALYVDSDMMVFRPIEDLWDTPFDDAQVLTVRTPEGKPTTNHSVLLIDCGAVEWDIREIVRGLDEHRYTYDSLMRDLCIVPRARVQARIPYVWNSLDRYETERTALLHFTALHSQPWTGTRHPFAAVWIEALFRAVDGGAVTRDLVRAEIEQGNVRPSLLYQLDSRTADPRAIPHAEHHRDAAFMPPYRKLPKNRFSQRIQRRLRGLVRQVWSRSASGRA